MVRNNNHKGESIQQVIDFVKTSGGIDYTHQVMQKFVDEALEILQTFKPSAYKESLQQMVEFTISRSK
jgi:octaprenyl-diphosphate synthase